MFPMFSVFLPTRFRTWTWARHLHFPPLPLLIHVFLISIGVSQLKFSLGKPRLWGPCFVRIGNLGDSGAHFRKMVLFSLTVFEDAKKDTTKQTKTWALGGFFVVALFRIGESVLGWKVCGLCLCCRPRLWRLPWKAECVTIICFALCF